MLVDPEQTVTVAVAAVQVEEDSKVVLEAAAVLLFSVTLAHKLEPVVPQILQVDTQHILLPAMEHLLLIALLFIESIKE
jgi:hypothetical protein